MSRGDSLARQLQLMQILETRHEVVVPEVAAELGYTQRTVYRDLAVLERVGVPIYQERQGKKARWRVVDGYRRRLSLTLSWPEMLALAAGQALVAGLPGTPFAEGAESALKKVGGALPPELTGRAEKAAARLSATLGPVHDYGPKAGCLRILADAVERNETVEFTYRKRGAKVDEVRFLDPYLLHVQAGAVYVVGFCHQREEVRTFLIDRVRDSRRTGAVFVARAPFTASSVLQGAFGPWQGPLHRIVLRFSPEAAPAAAERRVHPSQQCQWTSSGELDVELRMPICPPLLTWLLGWGDQVRVLSPTSLHHRLQQEHERAAATRPAASPRGTPAARRRTSRAPVATAPVPPHPAAG